MSHAAPAATPAAPRRRDPFRWVVEHPGIVDAVIFGGAAAVLFVAGLVSALAAWYVEAWWVFSVPMIALGAFSRTRPGWSALGIGALALAHFALGSVVLLGDVMIFYALFCVVAHASILAGRIALGAALFGALLQALGIGATFTSVDPALWFDVRSATAALASTGVTLVFGVVAVMGTWALGKYQRARIAQVRIARERAEDAEREREQRAALAVAGERARIAREMHDVVAHSLSVIIAQADGGRFVASQDPAKAVDVLETIGQTGRAALADMRSLLGVLRNEDETSFGPQPDLTTLPELLRRVRAAGLQVTDETSGDLGDLPPSLGLSMFRLIQEALTNVLKHAGPGASARVAVHRSERGLAIDVIDDGRGTDPDSDGHGHGLTGMRERVTLHGGTLQAGPLPAGGFRVSARVPSAPSETPAESSPASDDAPGAVPDGHPVSTPSRDPARPALPDLPRRGIPLADRPRPAHPVPDPDPPRLTR
ncbi:sensor histidine kinase [Brachybacterium huguangmaarense]